MDQKLGVVNNIQVTFFFNTDNSEAFPLMIQVSVLNYYLTPSKIHGHLWPKSRLPNVLKRDKPLDFESMNITEIFVIQKAYKVLP